jgi:hypothetical protein
MSPEGMSFIIAFQKIVEQNTLGKTWLNVAVWYRNAMMCVLNLCQPHGYPGPLRSLVNRII